jgi:lycopene beta-cyclase
VPRSAALQAGYQGGWFHPTTGYSFPLAMRLAMHIAQRDAASVDGPELRALIRERDRQQRFCILLNRLLFEAFEPQDRWRVLERFYRLPVETIRRFYALDMSLTDRVRILCGRPPGGFSLRLAVSGGAR